MSLGDVPMLAGMFTTRAPYGAVLCQRTGDWHRVTFRHWALLESSLSAVTLCRVE